MRALATSLTIKLSLLPDVQAMEQAATINIRKSE
jgi:hypothetical protein